MVSLRWFPLDDKADIQNCSPLFRFWKSIVLLTRPIFSQPSSRIALAYQSVCSRTITDRLYSDWIAEKNWTGTILDGNAFLSVYIMAYARIKLSNTWDAVSILTLNYLFKFFLRCSRIRVNLLSYKSKPTDKQELEDQKKLNE